MRKSFLIAVVAVLTASPVWAHDKGRHYSHHSHHSHHSHSTWWIAPAIIGGIVTYAMTRPPVIVHEQPQVVQVPPAPPGYHYETVLDANCQCYRTVLVMN